MSIILKSLLLVALAVALYSGDVKADTLIKLHKPGKKQIKILETAMSQVHYSGYNSDEDYGFTLQDLEIAQVHLDKAADPEIILRINNNGGYDGSAGYGFFILKKVAGRWTEIAGDDFGEKHAIIVTDRVVNGFKVFRVLTDPYDRIYQGNGYTCPKCPP